MTERTFIITSAEGLPIRTTLSVPVRPRALVVVIHGFKGFREWGFFPWISEQLTECDFAVCRFDMSRNGIGEDSSTFERLDLFADDTYSIQLADLRSVMGELERQGSFASLPRFLLGHSRGGAVALLGAQEMENLAGVVTWSAISTADRWDDVVKQEWRSKGSMDILNQRTGQLMRISTAILDDYDRHRARLDVRTAAAKLSAPLLVVHGLDDESVPPEEGRTLLQKAQDSSLLLVDRASHTYGATHPLVHVSRELELVMRATVSFLTAYSSRSSWNLASARARR